MSARLAALFAAIAGAFLLVLALVSSTTRIDAPEGEPGDPEPALQSATRALGEALRPAGTGLPAGSRGVLPLRAADAVLDESGAAIRCRAGSDAFLVRGVLTTPWVALDPEERTTGAPYAGERGTLAASPSRARLAVPVYPLAFNPRQIWWTTPQGLGLAFARRPRNGAETGRENEPLAPILAALSVRPPAARRFVVADARGRVAVARVVEADGSLLQTGCTCVAPAPWPGDCPPGRAGCRLDLVLDFTSPPPWEGFVPPESLGPLVAGGLLDEILFAVVDGARPWLARGVANGAGRFVLGRVADDADALSVQWPTAESPALRVEITVRGGAGARRTGTLVVPLPPP